MPASVSNAASGDGYRELRVWAEMLADAQAARISAENRVRNGGVDALLYEPQIAGLKRAEHDVALAMRRCFRRADPALYAWCKATHGVGEHLLSRLLGVIGHPRRATPHRWEGVGTARVLVAVDPFERNVAKLWAYCGHGDPERRKRKGMSAEDAFALGSPTAKMLVWNIASATIKMTGSQVHPGAHMGLAAGNESDADPIAATTSSQVACRRRSPYRDVYDEARERYADRVHAAVCVRCGPSGLPAQPGSAWSAAHQHAAALRLVGKVFLRDLWVAAG